MKTISRNEKIINKKETDERIENVETRVALIQALIPIALQSVNELLQQEVAELAGARYSRQKEDARGEITAGVNRAARFIWASRNCRWKFRASATSLPARK